MLFFCLNCYKISFCIFKKLTQLFFSNRIRHIVYNKDYIKSHQYHHNSGLQQNNGITNRILRVYFIFTVRGKKSILRELSRAWRGNQKVSMDGTLYYPISQTWEGLGHMSSALGLFEYTDRWQARKQCFYL